jgi:hypothetical protein
MPVSTNLSRLSPQHKLPLIMAIMAATPWMAHAALEAAKVPPINASVGTFNLPLTCGIKVPALGNLQVWNLATSAAISGAVPAAIGPGQRFYLSEGSGSLTMPAWVTSLAPIIGAKSANVALTEINISAHGATPEVINIAATPLILNGIPIVAGKPLTAGLPSSGVFTVGPWTAPDAGLVSLNFAGAKANVDMINAKGKKILTITATCATPPDTALLTMEVGGPAGQPDGKIEDVFVKYPTAAKNYDNGVMVPRYRCTLDGQPVEVGIAFGAVSPLKLSSNKTLQYKNASGALILPAPLVNSLLGKGVTSVSSSIRKLIVTTDGATKPSLDVATSNAGQLDTSVQPLVPDSPLIAVVPKQGDLTMPPIVKTSTSSVLRVSAGEAEVDLFYNHTSEAHRLSCGAPSPRIFLGASPL